MDNKEFGAKVRQLRENLGFTREHFCEDEIELTVRQLMRIEAGQSKPTLSKITFIAERLGLTLYQLMPDYIELPARYTRLKYDVLRIPTYGNPDLVKQRDVMLAEIYDEFYTHLPEEEKVAIDAFQSTIDVTETKSAGYGQAILDDYLYQIRLKEKFTVNDLLIVRLYVQHIQFGEITVASEVFQIFMELVEGLVRQVPLVTSEESFILRDTLLVAVGVLGHREMYDDVANLLNNLDELMNSSQDFQKKPILNMLQWKYELFANKDKEKAAYHYEKAIAFARLIDNSYLVNRLEEDWITDCEN